MEKFYDVVDEIRSQGIGVFILGCTELSVAQKATMLMHWKSWQRVLLDLLKGINYNEMKDK